MPTRSSESPVDDRRQAILDRVERFAREVEQAMSDVLDVLDFLGPGGIVAASGPVQIQVNAHAQAYDHLAPRSHPWRRQLYVKGRNMTVRQLIGTMLANAWTPGEAAANFDLPVEAIHEAMRYAEVNKDLLDYETSYENALIAGRG